MPFIAAFIALFSLACGIFFVTTAYSVFFGAPFVPTDKRRVETMLDLAKVRAGEKVVDLGCGDGRIVVAAAKRGARAEGWEISPYLWLLAKRNIRRAGAAHLATVRLGSYWAQRFDDADVVTLFLIDMQMAKMERKLRAELKPGSRVVSYAFKFPNWQPDEKREGVYLYTVKHS